MHIQWFWTSKEADGFRIYTGGVGNRPAGKHWFQTEAEMNVKVQQLENEGYTNRGETK